jgi:hypothetical protein
VEHQLLALLCFLGTNGTGMSGRNGCSVFRVGKGTLQRYKDRVVPAFLDYVSRKTLSNGLIQIEERRRNHLETERRADFGLLVPDCIGVVDGTLLPLAFRPSTHMTMMITKIETCGIVFTY